MSERFQASINVNDSKNTRLPIIKEFGNYRFGRDALAHVSRYLFVIEKWIELSRALKRPIRILDIGCGDVYTARTFIASFQIEKRKIIEKYIGLDIDDVSLARTKKTLPASMDIELCWRDFTTEGLTCFQDQQFDLVVCLEVLEHIQPSFVLPLIKEIKRVSPRALISTPNFKGGSGKLPEDHIKEWNIEELREVFKEAKFDLLDAIGTFSNLHKIREAAKTSEKIQYLLDQLEGRVSADFLSLFMAKFLPEMAQNYLYILGDWDVLK